MKPTIKLMKRLSLYLILILFTLQTPSWADDIRDFQIEGMSIGDSLLDYFSKEEIKNNTNTGYYTNNEYTSVEFFELPSFEIYETVEFNYKTDDKKYIIAAIAGTLFCEKNIEKCNKKQKEIDLEISNIFKKSGLSKKKDPSTKITMVPCIIFADISPSAVQIHLLTP